MRYGQPMPPRTSCGGIRWNSIAREMDDLRRLYTNRSVPGKPKVPKECVYALETTFNKWAEAEYSRDRGACDMAEELALDAVRYHGVFMGCKLEWEKKPKRRKKRKKR